MLSYNIALGANINSSFGSPFETLKICIEKLETLNIKVNKISHWYESIAFPDPLDPPFINCCLNILTNYKPLELLDCFKKIEEDFGRKDEKRWKSRVCDIDILSQEQQISPNLSTFNFWYKMKLEKQKIKKPNKLIIPHPRIQDRDFVLIPLFDVAENWVHPVFKKNIKSMLKEYLKKRQINLKKIS